MSNTTADHSSSYNSNNNNTNAAKQTDNVLIVKVKEFKHNELFDKMKLDNKNISILSHKRSIISVQQENNTVSFIQLEKNENSVLPLQIRCEKSNFGWLLHSWRVPQTQMERKIHKNKHVLEYDDAFYGVKADSGDLELFIFSALPEGHNNSSHKTLRRKMSGTSTHHAVNEVLTDRHKVYCYSLSKQKMGELVSNGKSKTSVTITSVFTVEPNKLVVICDKMHLLILSLRDGELVKESYMNLREFTKTQGEETEEESSSDEETESKSDHSESFTSYCIYRHYLFGLRQQQNNIIDVLDLQQQSVIGKLDLHEILKVHCLPEVETKKFSNIKVSADGLTLGVDADSTFYFLQIDCYLETLARASVSAKSKQTAQLVHAIITQQKQPSSTSSEISQMGVADEPSEMDETEEVEEEEEDGEEEDEEEEDEEEEEEEEDEEDTKKSQDSVLRVPASSTVAPSSPIIKPLEVKKKSTEVQSKSKAQTSSSGILSVSAKSHDRFFGDKIESHWFSPEFKSQMIMAKSTQNSKASLLCSQKTATEVLKETGFAREFGLAFQHPQVFSATDVSVYEDGALISFNAISKSKLKHWILTSDYIYFIYDGEKPEESMVQVYHLFTENLGMATLSRDQSNLLLHSDFSVLNFLQINNQETAEASKNQQGGSLFTLVVGQNKEQVLNNVIMFENREVASKLCILNGWDRKSLTIHALQSGLKNRELEVIEEAITNIDEEQEMLASCILAHFATTNAFTKGSDFKVQFIQLSLHYVSKLIEQKVHHFSQSNTGEPNTNSMAYYLLEDGQKIMFEPEETSQIFQNLNVDYSKWVAFFLQHQQRRQISTEAPISFAEQLALLNNIVITLRTFLIRDSLDPSGENYYNQSGSATDYSIIGSKPEVTETTPKAETKGVEEDEYQFSFSRVHEETDHDLSEEEDEDDVLVLNDGMLFQQYPLIYKKWQSLSEKDVITDSLKEGLISLAFSFLRVRTLNQVPSAQKGSTSDITTFDSFKLKAFNVVFNFFSNNEFETGVMMLKNLGENVVQHMKEISFLTSDVSLRNQLIRELKRQQALNSEDLALISYVTSLEKYYSETSFWKSFKEYYTSISKENKAKLTKEFFKKHYQYNSVLQQHQQEPDFDEKLRSLQLEYLYLYGDMDDVGEFNMNSDGFNVPQTPASPGDEQLSSSSSFSTRSSKRALKEAERSVVVTSKKSKKQAQIHGEYLYVTLEWIKKWTQDTKERILIERGKALEVRKLESKLRFYIAHHDLRGMISWSKGLQVESSFVMDISSTGIAEYLSQEQPSQEITNISKLIADELEFTSTFSRDVLLNSVGKRGIFVESEVRDLHKLIHRLAKTNQFLSGKTYAMEFDETLKQNRSSAQSSKKGSTESEKVESVDIYKKLLPQSTISKVHSEFITSFTFEDNLPLVFEHYLDTFDLWKAAHEQLPSEVKKKDLWISMLVLSRQPGQIYNLAISNAQRVLSSLPRENLSLNRLLASSRPFIALSTMVYSPLSIQESLNASISSPHYIGASKLSEILLPYPTFHAAIFKDNAILKDEHTIEIDESEAELVQGLTQEKEFSYESMTKSLEVAPGNIQTYERDVSLFQMLADTHQDINIDRVLYMDAQQYSKQNQEERESNLVDFSSEVVKPYAFDDNLNVEYFLTRGRPMDAFQCICSQYNSEEQDELELIDYLITSSYVSEESTETKSKKLKISEKDSQKIYSEVLEIALNHMHDKSITSSCKFLLELCGMPTENLIVQVHSLRRIVKYHYAFKTNKQETKSEISRIIQTILDLDREHDDHDESESEESAAGSMSLSQRQKMLLLKYLEEATEQKIVLNTQLRVKTYKYQIPLGNPSSIMYTSPWTLVFKFCQAHSLPLYTKHLQEYAKKNQWVALLHDSQVQNIPLETLISIIKEHMTDHALQDHIQVALHDLLAQQKMATATEDTSPKMQIFNVLIECNQKQPEDAVEYLLEKAVELSQPMLAVLVSCFSAPSNSSSASSLLVLKSLNAYLLANQKRYISAPQFQNQNIALFMDTRAKKKYESAEFDLEEKKQLKILQNMIMEYTYSQGGLPSASSNNISSQHYTNTSLLAMLIRGFSIFDDQSPIFNLLQFYKAFLDHRFSEAEKHLRLYISDRMQMTSNPSSTEVSSLHEDKRPHIIGKVEWIHDMSKILMNQLAKILKTSYDRTHFLRMLHELNYVDDSRFERFYQINCILSELQTSMLQNDYDINVMEDEPQGVIELLVKKKYFDEARKIALLYGISRTEITRQQAQSCVETTQSSPIWNYEKERTDLWVRIHQLFLKHAYEQDQAGNFFILQVKRLADSIPVSEVIMLLSLALEWYNGNAVTGGAMSTFQLSVPAPFSQPFASTFAAPTTPTIKAKPCRSKNDIEFLENNIALLTKGAQIMPNTSVIASPFSSSESNVCSSQKIYISSIILSICDRFMPMPRSSSSSSLYGDGSADSSLISPRYSTSSPQALENESQKVQLGDFLNSVIDSLLSEGKIDEAEKLCTYFKYQNLNLLVVKTALDVARYKIATNQIPKQVKQALQEFFSVDTETSQESASSSSSLGAAPNNVEIQQMLDNLCFLCRGMASKGARNFLKIISLNYRVATILQISYDSVVFKDEYEIFKCLLIYGKEMYKICSTFIILRNLRPERAAQICADLLFSQFCEYYVSEELRASHFEKVGTGNASQAVNISQSSTTAPTSLAASPTDSESSETLSWTSSSTSHYGAEQQGAPSIPSQYTLTGYNFAPPSATSSNSSQFEIVKFSMDDFTEFASLCQAPHALADYILKLIDEDQDTPPKSTLQCRVELLARAYWCFRIASSLDGIESLMKRIKEELVPKLIEEHQFALLVRLIVSLRNYSELDYLFDILMKHEQFEVILRRDTDRAVQGQLKLVLASFLQTKYPNDDEKLLMVYLRFNMYNFLGELYMKKGKTGITILSEQLNQLIFFGNKSVINPSASTNSLFDDPSGGAPLSLEEKIRRTSQYFHSAADAFMKDEAFSTAAKCMSLCNLCELQRLLYKQAFVEKSSNTIASAFSILTKRGKSTTTVSPSSTSNNSNIIVLNLTRQEARQFMKTHEDFYASLIIATSYDLNIMSEWIEPIYYQCIIKSNLQYFVSFHEHLPTPPTLFKEIAKRFKADSQNNLTTNPMIQAMKSFIKMCEDITVQSQLAKELGFRNV